MRPTKTDSGSSTERAAEFVASQSWKIEFLFEFRCVLMSSRHVPKGFVRGEV